MGKEKIFKVTMVANLAAGLQKFMAGENWTGKLKDLPKIVQREIEVNAPTVSVEELGDITIPEDVPVTEAAPKKKLKKITKKK